MTMIRGRVAILLVAASAAASASAFVSPAGAAFARRRAADIDDGDKQVVVVAKMSSAPEEKTKGGISAPKFGKVDTAGLLDKYLTPRPPIRPSATNAVLAAVAVLVLTQLELDFDFNFGPALLALFFAALAGGTSVVPQGNSNQVCLPLWVYEWGAWIGKFALFWYATLGPYACEKRLDLVGADPSLSPEALAKSPDALDESGLEELKARIMNYETKIATEREEDVVQLFDTLEPAVSSTMVGHTFRGSIVITDSMLDVLQYPIKWLRSVNVGLGKRFFTPYYGDPLIVRLPNNEIIIPFPFLGNVGLHELEYRGKKQATMVYDNQPWMDQFRILDDGKDSGGEVTVLGVWNVRDVAGGWFVLTQIKDLTTTELMAEKE